jgi:hypothetical protein
MTIGVALVLALATAGSSHANLLTNGNAETGDLTGWVDPLAHGFNIGYLAILPAHPPVEGTYVFWAGVTGPANGAWSNEIRQDVDVSGYASAIDGGTATGEFDGWGRSAEAGGSHDDATIIVEYRDAGQNLLGAFNTGVILPFNTWVHVIDLRPIPIGTRSIRVRLTGVRSVGASTEAIFDALSLTVNVTVPVDQTTWGSVKALYR